MVDVRSLANSVEPVQQATGPRPLPGAPAALPGLVPLRRDQATVATGRGPMTLNVQALESQISKKTGVAPTPGNKMQLYVDGKNAYPQILGLINSAQKSLHLEMYIFRDDKASWDVAEALADRAAHGVKVRVMTDWMGSPTSSPVYDFLRQNGVEVRHFTAQSLSNPTQIDHRKMIIADGAKAITGGMNIADTYANSWHDAIVTLEGPVVHDLQNVFLGGWKDVGGSDVTRNSDVYAAALPQAPGGTSMRVLTTDPGQNIREAEFAAIDNARSRINIENPYFTDDKLVDKLLEARKRGVEVNVVVPAVSDVKMVKAASRYHFRELLDAGAHVYLYKDRMVHTKAMTVDGVWGTMGSCNADNLSLRVNREMNVTFADPSAVSQLDNNLFRKDFVNSTEIKKPDMTMTEKVQTFAARIMNKWL